MHRPPVAPCLALATAVAQLFAPAALAAGPQPDAPQLAAARDYLAALPPPDSRCLAIAGVGQRTVVGVEGGADGFAYLVNSAGDGTVPLASATQPGLPTWYLRCEHSVLPRDPRAGRALLELLAAGTTARLTTTPPRHAQRLLRVSEAALRGNWNEKVDWATLAPEARRHYLEHLNLAPPQYATTALQG